MRHLLLAILAFGIGLLPLRSEDKASEKFYELAGGCSFEKGGLVIEPCLGSRIWHNGVEQPSDFGKDQPVSLTMVSGDTCDVRSPVGFYRYRLDRLTPKQATFTRSTYSAYRQQLSVHSWKIGEGHVIKVEQFIIPVPLMSLVDYGYPNVEVDWKKSARSK